MCVADTGEAVCDENHAAPARPRAQRFVHRLFGLGIERCGGFVPDYPRCIAIHAAHYSHALPLSARKILAAAELARPQRLPAERQAFDDVDRTRVTRGAQQTFVVRIGEIVTSAADIIARAARPADRLLPHHSDTIGE